MYAYQPNAPACVSGYNPPLDRGTSAGFASHYIACRRVTRKSAHKLLHDATFTILPPHRGLYGILSVGNSFAFEHTCHLVVAQTC
jgi:hypothetical protein